MSKSTSLEVVVSDSWDYTVTSGYFSISSKDVQKIRCTAEVADDADTGLEYGMVKVIKLIKCWENADTLFLCFPPAYILWSSKNLCKCQ